MTITSERVTNTEARVRAARAVCRVINPCDSIAAESWEDPQHRAYCHDIVDAVLSACPPEEPDTTHTCHDHCQRIECVLRRERDALVEGVRELRDELASNTHNAGNEALADHLSSLIIARVEGERHE